MGGFSRAYNWNRAGAFPNLAPDGQRNCGDDIKQFGQLLATILRHCYGSSEYNKVNVVRLFVSFSIRKEWVVVHLVTTCSATELLDAKKNVNNKLYPG